MWQRQTPEALSSDLPHPIHTELLLLVGHEVCGSPHPSFKYSGCHKTVAYFMGRCDLVLRPGPLRV